jgi:hypothetical protein
MHEWEENLEEKHQFTQAIVINQKLNMMMRKQGTRTTFHNQQDA